MSWDILTQKSGVVEKIQLADTWVNLNRHTYRFPVPDSASRSVEEPGVSGSPPLGGCQVALIPA